MWAYGFAALFAVYLIAWPASAQSQDLEIQQGISVSDQVSNSGPDTRGIQIDLPPEFQADLPQASPIVRPERKRGNFDLGFLEPLFKVLFYGGLAAIVLFIVFNIIRALVIAKRNYTPQDQEEAAPVIPTYTPDSKTARVLLEDAEKLAAVGRYEEAVHILLFRSIQDLEEKRPHHVRKSLTSREIATLEILSQKARNAFLTIGQLVERSFFGGRALNADDFEISKTAYKAFAYEKIAR